MQRTLLLTAIFVLATVLPAAARQGQPPPGGPGGGGGFGGGLGGGFGGGLGGGLFGGGGFGIFGGQGVRPLQGSEKVSELTQELRLLRFLARSRLDSDLLEKLLTILEGSQADLKKGDQEAAGEMSRHAKRLDEVKKLVLRGEHLQVPTQQETDLTLVRVRFDSQRNDYLRQVAEEIRKLLESDLTPEEKASSLAAAGAMVREARASQSGGGFGGQGGPGGGASGRDLDSLRNANGGDYDRQKLQFALRSAGIPNWFATPGIFGQPGGPGGGGIVFRAGPGQVDGGPGGGTVLAAPGGGGFGGPQGITPPNLNDPSTKSRMSAYSQFADQVRNLPPQAYQQSRDRLIQRLDSMKEQSRIDAPVTDEAAMNAIIQAMLRPEMVNALKLRLGKETGAAARVK